MHLKLFKTIIKKKSGFTLIELSMVLVIVGILFSSGLIAYQSILFKSRTKITEENMDTVYKAIGNYLITNRKLPCPASLVLPESDVNYGTEVLISGACPTLATMAGTGVVISSTNNNLAYGMVPVKTLGLSNLIAKDGFNTKLSYIVDTNFTTLVNSAGTTGFEGYDPSSANITIKELSTTGPNIIIDGIMVIISHGTNKLGGFNANSATQNSNPTSADELDNIRTASFNNTFVTNSTDSLFDDVLIFKNKMQLAIDAGFENMMCRGITESLLCYDNTGLSSNLTWPSANYGEFKTTSSSCPAGCTNKLSGYPARKCGKYGIWNKVIYPCYNLTSP